MANKIRDDLLKYAVELYYEIESVCYQEMNTPETREILRNYMARKQFSLPHQYLRCDFLCNEANNNAEKTQDGTIRFDVYMYGDDESTYDNLTITYGIPSTVHLNGKHIMRF